MPDPGAVTAAWLERYEHSLLGVFGRPQLVLEHGEGAWVWDVEGRRYLDLLGGIAVNALGHGAASQSERSQQQVQRRAHHLREIAGAGNLLTEISQGAEGVNEFLGRKLHQCQWTMGVVSNSESVSNASCSSFASTTCRVRPSISKSCTV